MENNLTHGKLSENDFCVILAGGTGSRLWPVSRDDRPKQFIDFLGTGRSLLQTTFARYARFLRPENIVVVTNHEYAELVRAQLPDLPAQNLLLEPMRRNTVPSVVWASMELLRRCPEARMVVTPADQLIVDEGRFEEDVCRGLAYVAAHDRLLTLGVTPTRAETAFGYIQMGDQRGEGVYEVKTFTEKPEAAFAHMFVENGEFLWNTGLFVWKATTFLTAAGANAGALEELLQSLRTEMAAGEDGESLLNRFYPMSPSVSIEVGLLEKVENVDVLLCGFGWSDIGTWEALYEALPKDGAGNAVVARNGRLYECENCIVRAAEGKLVVVEGLKDYMVVDEGNVLVVCRKDDQKAIRRIVNELRVNSDTDNV